MAGEATIRSQEKVMNGLLSSHHIFKRVVVVVGGVVVLDDGPLKNPQRVCYGSHTRQLTHLSGENSAVTNPLSAFIRAARLFQLLSGNACRSCRLVIFFFFRERKTHKKNKTQI